MVRVRNRRNASGSLIGIGFVGEDVIKSIRISCWKVDATRETIGTKKVSDMFPEIIEVTTNDDRKINSFKN